jgi:folate-binding protein YgfZ
MTDVTAYWLPRDFTRVTGPDASDWLQGQLSQDLATVPVGSAALSFLLQPQGKVDALVRVHRVGDDELVLAVDAGFGEIVRARLRRFMLRVKAEVTEIDWRCLALRGAGAEALDAGGVDATWLGWPGVEVVGPDPVVPDGVDLADEAAYEQQRIAAGVPVMGAEITDKTIPAELGPWVIDQAVSFTKGCFTGQELVARIDSRGGNVPRRLRRITSASPLAVGDQLESGGKVVGSITSAATRRDGSGVALAFVGRDVEAPATAIAGGVEVEVSAIEPAP